MFAAAQRLFLYSYSLFMFISILVFIFYIHSSTDVCPCPEAWVKPIPSVGRDRKWTFPKTFQILTKRFWKEALHAQGFQIAKENFGLQVAWIIFLTKDVFERCYGNIGINEMDKNLNNKGKNTPWIWGISFPYSWLAELAKLWWVPRKDCVRVPTYRKI